jgi:hypothetical protein
MLRPTLVVGLGTSGLEIVSEMQKLMYETFGHNSLPIFRYVYIETDAGKTHDQTPVGSDILRLQLTVQSLSRAHQVLKNNTQLSMDWISGDLSAQLAFNAQGAGGVRPAGRLLLWGDGNFGNVYNALSDSWQQIVNAASSRELRDKYSALVSQAGGFETHAAVYVVGTLVGGTCSGMFIDIGYMLRRITDLEESGALYGIFLVPGENLPLTMGYGNCYGALTELQFFRETQSFYQEVWPNDVRIPEQQLPPYGVVYLISPEYGSAQYAGMGLPGCYKIAALKLFCDLIGLSNLRGSVLADGLNDKFGFYATFGISAVIYPKYALMEAAGCSQGKSLCNRWLSSQSYITTTGDATVINETAIKEEANKFFAEKLTEVFTILSSKGSHAGGLRFDIEEDIDRIIDQQEARPEGYLAGRFSSGNVGTYYNAVIANLGAAQDQLIRDINSFLHEKAKETENFEYLKILLKNIDQCLKETVDYWDNCRIPQAANQWNDFVARQAMRMLERKFVWLGQRRYVLQDRVENLLTRLKMYAMRKVLTQIKSSLARGNLTTSDQSIALPTVERLMEFQKKLQTAEHSLEQREIAITNEVSNVSVPIFRVWNSGSFKTDLENLNQAYKANHGPASLSDVSLDPPLEFFSKTSEPGLFETIKVGYQGKFRGLLPSVNVIQVAKDKAEQTLEYAQRALSGLLRLDLPATSGVQGVPRFVLGADTASLKTLVTRLQAEGLQDFREEHVKQLGPLDHAVVFYEEKAQVNPFKTLSVRPTLKHFFENSGKDNTGESNIDTSVWKQHRLAYNIEKRRHVARLKGLINFVLDFGLIWELRRGGIWQPKSLRWNDLPVTLDFPPHFRCNDANGNSREFELDSSAESVRGLAKSPVFYNVLRDKLKQLVEQKGEQELYQLFEGEVKQYLEERDGGTSELKQKWYFGKAGEEDGLIHGLLSGRY